MATRTGRPSSVGGLAAQPPKRVGVSEVLHGVCWWLGLTLPYPCVGGELQMPDRVSATLGLAKMCMIWCLIL